MAYPMTTTAVLKARADALAAHIAAKEDDLPALRDELALMRAELERRALRDYMAWQKVRET